MSDPALSPPSARPLCFRCDAVVEADCVRIVPAGELDLATISELERAVREHFTSENRRLVLDLRRLSFIDSTGLRLILRTSEAARRAHRRFTLIPGPPAVQRIFEVTGTSALLPFEPARPVTRANQRGI